MSRLPHLLCVLMVVLSPRVIISATTETEQSTQVTTQAMQEPVPTDISAPQSLPAVVQQTQDTPSEAALTMLKTTNGTNEFKNDEEELKRMEAEDADLVEHQNEEVIIVPPPAEQPTSEQPTQQQEISQTYPSEQPINASASLSSNADYQLMSANMDTPQTEQPMPQQPLYQPDTQATPASEQPAESAQQGFPENQYQPMTNDTTTTQQDLTTALQTDLAAQAAPAPAQPIYQPNVHATPTNEQPTEFPATLAPETQYQQATEQTTIEQPYETAIQKPIQQKTLIQPAFHQQAGSSSLSGGTVPFYPKPAEAQ